MRYITLALLALATPAAARDLPVPATKGWQHARTGLVLAATLDGLPRTKLTDSTATEHDVTAEFAAPDLSTVVTVFLFHPAVDDVAIWFDRSETALYDRALFGDVAPASAGPVAFAPPGSATPSGLRRVYAPGKGPYRSTALAVMPLGEWLVAIRASSKGEAPAALDARLSRVVAALRWPTAVAPAPAAAPVPACPTALAFTGKAKRTKAQAGDMLMSLLGGALAARAKTEPPRERVSWCRDPSSAARYGVYRAGTGTGYTMAVQDAGRVVHVTPSLDAQMGRGSDYRMSLTDVDGTTSSFPPFDRLPRPEQVFDALSGPRTGTGRGNRITIGADAL